ncbi:AraC family transcriptional regulator [Ketobacter sp.]|uniref:AraC family transcriptional regulator n=1 Tax=Ketobacter sp. TaxID=2083498 RepID=UPI000F29C0A4|nr:AraC family transcriptional regulator [Ketobacter sp.]RLU00724.1 MAG: AraC family transcriptional regulator [Ketobacter sp.]
MRVAEAHSQVTAGDIHIPIRYAGLLFSSIQHYGVPGHELLRNTGIPESHLHEQDYFIDFQGFRTLCHNAIRLCGSTEVAICFGKHLVLPAHGTWGLAVMTSPTLLDAILLFKQYVELELPFFVFDFREENEHVVMEMKGTPAIADNLPFHLEYIVVAEAINLQYALQDASDLEVHCAYPAPAYGDQYHQLLGREVTFDSTFTGARFQRKHLAVAMPDANHASHLMLMKTLQQARDLSVPERSMRERVVEHLQTRGEGFPDQETVARELHISSRKLRYRLKEENTSYKAIVSDLKKQEAFQRLRQGMSVTQVALELGYEDPSNFSRAFRKWFGVSPSAYHTLHHREPLADQL